MAYVHCLPARVIAMRHGLDNIVTGTLRTRDDEIVFRTRKHIIKATNRIYRAAPWKPAAGADVLIDGELSDSGIVIDHIEPDLKNDQTCHSPHLDVIAQTLADHPPASSTLRVRRDEEIIRIRFSQPISGKDDRGKDQPGILHGMYNLKTGEWNLWTCSVDGGAFANKGITEHNLFVIAREAGIDMDAPKQEDDDPEIKKPVKIEKPPFDDCPF